MPSSRSTDFPADKVRAVARLSSESFHRPNKKLRLGLGRQSGLPGPANGPTHRSAGQSLAPHWRNRKAPFGDHQRIAGRRRELRRRAHDRHGRDRPDRRRYSILGRLRAVFAAQAFKPRQRSRSAGVSSGHCLRRQRLLHRQRQYNQPSHAEIEQDSETKSEREHLHHGVISSME
jgi:hypothetical protein